MPKTRKTLPTLPLERELSIAAELLYKELETPSASLISWAQRSGLTKGKSELRRVLAQQAALEMALVALLNYLLPNTDNHATVQDVVEKLPFSDLIDQSQARFLFADPLPFVQALQNALPQDVLGDLYEQMTPQAERRTLGQYWTPTPIVEFMTRWALEAGPRILEPAVGSGRFVQTLEALLPEAGGYIRGHEISPLVLLVALVNSHLTGLNGARLDLRLEDFLNSSDDEAVFDAVVCNPPYTRHHHIGNVTKMRLSDRAFKAFGVRPSGFTSLFVYFFIHALTKVRPGGRLAFITPSELYEASYSRQFKAIVGQHAMPEAIITFDKSTQIFEGVDTAGCITLAQRGVSCTHTLLIEVKAWPGANTLLQAVSDAREGVFAWGKVRRVAIDQLGPDTKWSNLRQMNDAAKDQPTLGSVAKIMRGVATGANDYFCLSDAEVSRYRIPERYLQPVITKTRTAQSLSFEFADFEALRMGGRKVWLFSCFDPLEQVPDEVREYIALGEQIGLHKRSLLSLKKKRWYMAERRSPPPILFTYLSRGSTRFIHNAMGAQALNVFLLAYPHPRIANDPERVKALIGILNSKPVTDQLHLVGRSYGGDTVKLEPREMDRLPILDPASLSQTEINQIIDCFDALRRAEGAARQQSDLDAVVRELLATSKHPKHSPEPQMSLFGDLVAIR